MANIMVQTASPSKAIPRASPKDQVTPVRPLVSKAVGGKRPAKAATKVKTASSEPSVNLVGFTKEISSMLKQVSENQNKLSDRFDQMSNRVDNLYQYVPSYDTGDEDYQEVDNYECNESGSNPSADGENLDQCAEPTAKRLKLDGGLFGSLADKYKHTELLDNEVDEQLANFVNSSFRGGMTDDSYSALVKDIHRPVNCENLVKTRVNSQMWGYLKPSTQSFDSKMQHVQDSLVKATSNISKLLDKGSHGEAMDSQMLEWGTDAIGILGYAHKQINLRRKESHKCDLDRRYHHLTSASVPFTDQLYGDDVCKNVKEIQDISKISKQLSVVSRFNRGSRRPAGRGWFSGRARGRGRGQFQPGPRQQWQAPRPQNFGSKNQRAGLSRK